MTTNKTTWQERIVFEEADPIYPHEILFRVNKDGSRSIATLDDISQEIERAVRERGEELREKLGKEVAIHKQLANEWTGIKINGFRESINPHEEKLEVFSTILSLLQEDISNKE